MRGLKLKAQVSESWARVASFTDAWIETGLIRIELLGGTVASFTDAWIETVNEAGHTVTTVSRIFYRCVD